MDNISDAKKIVFGNGCFWCTEAVFSRLRGVISVRPGYAGGSVANPTYEQVCGGKTGHAEAIEIEYNPILIKFADILNVFFATHDPTALNRQGNDIGTQYRSVIFYKNEEERGQAEDFIKKLAAEKVFSAKITTALEPLEIFYPAEDYHREYYENHSDQPYCQAVISPKIAKLRTKFQHLLKKSE
ncbi:MAG: peptide-methionine (S)-S-oxide reductase MsrA [bacterium]|nr:peptide-methionine (S)-S-oxide reductase MsrA [bacterium]